MKSEFIDSIEKAFRYVVPGFVFVLLWKVAFPKDLHPWLGSPDKGDFYLLVACLGMVLYGLHRVIMSGVVELILYKFGQTAVCVFASESRPITEFPAAIAKFMKERQLLDEDNRRLSSHLWYRWAIQHYCLMFCEMAVILSIFAQPESLPGKHRGWVLLVLVTLSVLTVWTTWIFYLVEREAFVAILAKRRTEDTG